MGKTSAWDPDKVTTEKLSELYKRVEEVLEELFERDEDGDFPVEVRLVNRTLYETMAGYLLVPYTHRAKTYDDFDKIMSCILSNLGRSSRQLEQVIQIRKDRKLPAPAEPASLIAAPVVVAPKPKIISYVPELVAPKDLVKGDNVILFEGPSHKHSEAVVVDTIPVGIQLTDDQAKLWFGMSTPRKTISCRKALDYVRVVFQRKDNTYLVAPYSVDQLQSCVVKVISVRSQDS